MIERGVGGLGGGWEGAGRGLGRGWEGVGRGSGGFEGGWGATETIRPFLPWLFVFSGICL